MHISCYYCYVSYFTYHTPFFYGNRFCDFHLLVKRIEDDLTEEERAQKRREFYKIYEKEKRKRVWMPKWAEGRSWLKNTDNGMICTICQVCGLQLYPYW